MGKSACARLLLQKGLRVIDTDDLARQVVEPGNPALAEVAEAFGDGMLDEGGVLKREELGRKVFADPEARRCLERILHPRIRQLWKTAVQQWQSEGHQLGFIVIPLLFETGAEAELDRTICVACSGHTQRERLHARGWTTEKISHRTASQLSVEDKISRSDFVIWSEGTLEVHAAQLERILRTAAGERPKAST